VTRDSRRLPEPSWPTVIATTLRLWLQRHVLPEFRYRLFGGRTSGRLWPAALLIIIVAAGATYLVAGRISDDGTRSQSGSSAANSGGLPAAAAARNKAAAWIEAQVSDGLIVACDPLMCTTLQQHGFPAADLAQIDMGSGDPLGSDIIVSTAAVRSLLGPRLAQLYAPTVIASFGSGQYLIQVRITAAGSAIAAQAANRAALQARITAGRELDRNKNIHAPRLARAELAGGHVDSRLMDILALMAHRVPVQILGFGDGGPGTNAPLRLMRISAPTATYLHRLLVFLRAQLPPFAPNVSTYPAGLTTTVQIEFPAPSPTTLSMP